MANAPRSRRAAAESYRLSFSTGGLQVQQGEMLISKFLEVGDWKKVREFASTSGVFSLRTESSAKRQARELAHRLSHLTDAEMHAYIDGSRANKNLLMWIAVCRTYQLISEFQEEVVFDRYLSRRLNLIHDDFDLFWNRKAEWRPELEKTSTSTREKLRQVLFRMLREAGLLSDQNRISPISAAICDDVVIEAAKTSCLRIPGLD